MGIPRTGCEVMCSVDVGHSAIGLCVWHKGFAFVAVLQNILSRQIILTLGDVEANIFG